MVTTDDFLQAYIENCLKLKNDGAIDSVKSAVIGAIYHRIISFYVAVKSDKREGISEEEEKELYEIFLRRIPEIKSKLDILLNL